MTQAEEKALVDSLVTEDQWDLKPRLLSLVNDVPRFSDFLSANSKKIKKKFREHTKSIEDQKDDYSELLFACLLLTEQNIQLQFEPNIRSGRNPDFIVSYLDFDFAFEVKRIRGAMYEQRWNDLRNDISRAITTIPSNVGFIIYANIPSNEDYETLLSRLENDKEDIIAFITERVKCAEHELNCGIPYECCLPDYRDLIQLNLSKSPPQSEMSMTSDYGGTEPVFYRQNEFWKFIDSILEKIGQLTDDLPNVLAFHVESTTHEIEDLRQAFIVIENPNTPFEKAMQVKLENHGLHNRDDLKAAMRKVSAILFRGWGSSKDGCSNYVLCNSNASHPLTADICTFLRKMEIQS